MNAILQGNTPYYPTITKEHISADGPGFLRVKIIGSDLSGDDYKEVDESLSNVNSKLYQRRCCPGKDGYNRPQFY